MLRSALIRRTPLKRSSKPLPRKSAKQRDLEREHEPARLAYRLRYPCCPWTGIREGLTIHEIIGAGLRCKTYGDPRFWLPINWYFHSLTVQDEPKARQWARKIWLGDGYYDLAALTLFPGHRVSEAAVKIELDILIDELGFRSYADRLKGITA